MRMYISCDGPYVARIVRVSPPELAREFPGPHASMSVTRAPRRTSSSADQPPNAPAPTTITEGLVAAMIAGPPRQIALAAAPCRKVRRELRMLIGVFRADRPERRIQWVPGPRSDHIRRRRVREDLLTRACSHRRAAHGS